MFLHVNVGVCVSLRGFIHFPINIGGGQIRPIFAAGRCIESAVRIWIHRACRDCLVKHKNAGGIILRHFLLVAHRGFEPLISALRGRCPRPLDEWAIRCNVVNDTRRSPQLQGFSAILTKSVRGGWFPNAKARPDQVHPRVRRSVTSVDPNVTRSPATVSRVIHRAR